MIVVFIFLLVFMEYYIFVRLVDVGLEDFVRALW